MYEEWIEGNALVVNARISRDQMKQLVAVVAVCRLTVLNGTSCAGTSESASPKKWKDEDLGWFPNPKGEYTDFFFSD